MYEFILDQKLATSLVAIFLAAGASLLMNNARLWARGLLYSFTPALAAAFYATAFFAEKPSNFADLGAGLLFEFALLILFYAKFGQLKKGLSSISRIDAVRALSWSLLLQVALSAPNLAAGGFGIFSDGSRIEYLSAGSIPKYLTYAAFLVSMTQVALLGALINATGRLGALGWAVVAANFALSVASGSKGGVFLWMASIACLVDYRRARIPAFKLFGVAMIGAGAALTSSILVAQFLDLELDVFFDLVLNRFFLNNDARALALDMRSAESASYSLFSEAFRSLGNLFGLPPRNDPLGVLLYSEGLSVTNGNGANASFMALASYYFPSGYVLLPAMIGLIGAIGIALAARISENAVKNPARRALIQSIWLTVLLNYSQDFLAFQVVLPLAVIAVVLIWLCKTPANVFTFKLQHGRV